MEQRCHCGNVLEPSDEMCDECYAINEYYIDRVLPLNFHQTPNRQDELEPEEVE